MTVVIYDEGGDDDEGGDLSLAIDGTISRSRALMS